MVFSFPPHRAAAAPTELASGSGALAQRAEGFERSAILAELKAQQYHITHAAEALGLERGHLYKKFPQLGIDLQSLRKQNWKGELKGWRRG